jgi:hypothetical protein
MRLATILGVCLAVQTAASGGTITISGSGTWDSTVASSGGLSAPGATWSFSFDVPDPLVNNPTSQVTHASYSLNGTPVPYTITAVDFYSVDFNGRTSGGLFDMHFSNGGIVALYGAQIESTAGSLSPGPFPATIDVDRASTFVGPPTGEGRGSVNVVVTAVPEPATLVDGGIALACLAGLDLARRRRIAARSRAR